MKTQFKLLLSLIALTLGVGLTPGIAAQLTVTLTPAAGTPWRVNNGAWQASGATATGLAAGNHTVEYNSLAGYTAPASETVTLSADQSLALNRSYTAQTARFNVLLTPETGKWRLNGGAWRSSDSPIFDLPLGAHLVEYNNLGGYAAPAAETVNLAAGNTTIQRSYTALAKFNVILTPGTAKWRLDGGAWRSSDSPIFDLPLGAHLVEYYNLAGYTAPAAETVTLPAGTTTLQRNYTQLAKLNVILTPDTAKWRLDGGAWRSSDTPVFDLPLGSYLIEYKELGGYLAPAAENVTLIAGTNTLQRSYTSTAQAAQLTINLTPSTGQWRIDGGAWSNSGTTVTGLAAGNHTVEYNTVAGYTAPAPEAVTLTANQSLVLNRAYTTLTSSISVNLTPAEAGWRLGGGAWQASGTTVTLEPGQHLLEFQPVGGHLTPPPETISLAAGQNLSLQRQYEAINTSLTVVLEPAIGAWFLGGYGPLASGTAATQLAPGQYEIRYEVVPGYTEPPSETVTLRQNEPITLTRTYVPQPTRVTVTLEPSTAQWRVDGGAWQASGATLQLPAPGNHSIEYQDLPGHIAPPSETVFIPLGWNESLLRSYQVAPTQLTVVLDPTGGEWRVDGGAWQSSGTTLTGLDVGTHVIDYRDTFPERITPFSEKLVLAAGQVANLVRRYDVPTVAFIATDLGSLGGDETLAVKINLAGTAAGYSKLPSGEQRIVRFRAGAVEDLGAPAWNPGGRLGLNNADAIAGALNHNGTQVAFIDDATGRHVLGTFGATESAATDINDAGVVVGFTITNALVRGFRYADGAMTAIGATGTSIFALNNSGVMAGQMHSEQLGRSVAFRSTNGAFEEFSANGEALSHASDLNEAGTLVGFSVFNQPSVYHEAFKVEAGVRTALLTAPGASSYAHGVNRDGVVVGSFNLGGTAVRAFVHVHDTLRDLNDWVDLPDGVVLREAIDINDLGQIVAYSEQRRAYLLTPVNSPGAVQIFVATPGVQWRIDGGAWQPSGAAVLGVAAGQHTIEYSAAPGQDTPPSETIQVSDGRLTRITRNFTPAQLTVTLQPATAMWRVDGGAWQASGSTVTGLAAGNHTIEYSAVVGYSPQPAETITLTAGESLQITRTYVPLLYTIESMGIGGLYTHNGNYAGGAHAINLEGAVAGGTTLHGQIVGYIYQDGVVEEIGSLGGPSFAMDLNDSRVAVGFSLATDPSMSGAHAVRYAEEVLQPISPGEAAGGINSAGIIVGRAQSWGAFLYVDGTMHELGTWGDFQAGASDINDANVIVGYASNGSGSAARAVRYQNGQVETIPGLGGTVSLANAINNAGLIVGDSSLVGSTPRHAFLHKNGVSQDLGTLGGPNSRALDLNDSGVIVGWADVAADAPRAFVYRDGVMLDLNGVVSLPAGVVLTAATGINATGQIIANGSDAIGYILTPVTNVGGTSVQLAGGVGQWRVAGGAWQASGALVAGLTAGSHLIEYAPVAGYATPAGEIITISGGRTMVARRSYATLPPPPGSIMWAATGTDFIKNTNWIGSITPANDIATNTAVFTGDFSSAQPVLTTHRSIGGLLLDDLAITDLDLTGSGTLTVGSNGIRNGRPSGLMKISLPLVFATNLTPVNVPWGGQTILSGNLSGNSLRKTGAGTLTLLGNAGNSATHVAEGTLQIGGPDGMVSGNISTDLGASIVFDRNEDLTYGGAASGEGSLVKLGASTLTLSGLNPIKRLAVSAGTLTIPVGDQLDFPAVAVDTGATIEIAQESFTSLTGNGYVKLGWLHVGSESYSGTDTFSGVITGNGMVHKVGQSTWILTGANNFTGGLSVEEGLLVAGATNTFSLYASLTVNATVNLDNFNQSVRTLRGGTDGVINLGSGRLAVLQGDTGVFSGAIGGTGGLRKVNSGALLLSGSRLNFTGPLEILGGGSKVQVVAGSWCLPASAPLIVDSGGTLELNSASNHAVGSLAGNGTVLLNSSSLSIGGLNTSTAFSGLISGTGPLKKTGPGALVLSRAAGNTYTGGTQILGGTLSVGNTSGSALGTGPINVSSGATLAGTGRITGSLILYGTLSPGDSPGHLTSGPQMWNGGGAYRWEINNATGGIGTNWDHATINGDLYLTATPTNRFTISLRSLTSGNAAGLLPNFNPAGSYSFRIVTATSISGFNPAAFAINTDEFANSFTGAWSIAQSGNALNLVYTPVSALARLTVTLAPAAAQWRVDGGLWRNSGTTANGLTAGSHTIEYSSLAGYTSPPTETVVLVNGQVRSLNRVYAAIPTELTVHLSPTSARWRIDGGGWNASGTTVLGLTPGTHSIEYESMPGYTAPANESVVIAAGQSLSLNRSYLEIPTQLTITLAPASGQWRVDGGAWRASGTSLVGLTAGVHLVEYSKLSGYLELPGENITLSAGQTLSFSRSYTPTAYTAVNIGSLGGSAGTFGTGLNLAGEMSGYSYVAGDNAIHSFRYVAGHMYDLGPGRARAINESDDITGTWEIVGGRAYRYIGAMYNLGTLGGARSEGLAINNESTVVGYSHLTDGTSRAFQYLDDNLLDLGTLGGTESAAYGINDAGVIVGEAELASGVFHAFRYRGAIMEDLGTLGNGGSTARAINDAGVIVGATSVNGSDAYHAFRYADGVMQDLGTLDGGESSIAYAINESGHVVGTSEIGGGARHAFVYRDGRMEDLNNLIGIPGGYLEEAVAINDLGQILANGSDKRAYLLTPVNGSGGVQIHFSGSGLGEWRVDGGAWQMADAALLNLAPGTHTIEYNSRSGYTAPITETVTAVSGRLVELYRSYTTANNAWLRVFITPYTGKWRVDGGLWQDSSVTVTGLSVGSHTIEYKRVLNYAAATTETVTLSANQVLYLNRSYTYDGPPIHLTVNLTNSAAQWRVWGGAWQASGATITGLSPGDHVIEYNSLTGHIAPSTETVTVTPGQSLVLDRVYTPQPTRLTIDLNHPAGQWRVDGGTWQGDNTTLNLVPGAHTVEYSTVPGWSSPTTETITLESGQLRSLTRNYLPLPASLSISLNPSGGRWWIKNASQSSGAIVSDLDPGTYLITYTSLAGYDAPAPEFVSLTPGQSLSFSRNYTPRAAQLTVSLIPSTGQWRVDGGMWQASGATVSGLNAGPHTVQFSPLSGYVAPLPETINLTDGQSLAITRNYEIYAPAYTVTDLGTLGGISTVAAGLNLAGTVTGYSRTADGDMHAFRYRDGALQDLGAPAGFDSRGFALNDHDHVVGTVRIGTLQARGFLHDGSAMLTLGAFSDGTSEAYAINNAGTIVGSSPVNGVGHVFRFQNGAMEDLGLYQGFTVPFALNEAGTIVGMADHGSGINRFRAFSYTNGTWQDLGTLGGEESQANAINEAGIIVGGADVADGSERAFRYSNGVMENLGTLGGSSSSAYGINNAGTITGTSSIEGSGTPHAFVYSNGTMRDLNSWIELPGVTLTEALGPNDLGQIVANGSNNRAYLLTPINAPGGLQVTLAEPAGQWRVDGGAWQASGASVLNLAIGNHQLEYKSADAFASPFGETVTISSGRLLQLHRSYAATLVGGVRAFLTPEAESRWRLDGGAWLSSGTVVANVSLGSHVVEFMDITGYITPYSQTIMVRSGQTTEVSGLYTPLGGVRVFMTPETESRWRLDGGEWLPSGTVVPHVWLGSHLIEFMDIAGYITPYPQTIMVHSGQTTEVSGLYTALGGVRVFMTPETESRWRLDGGEWLSSGTVVPHVWLGSHLVEFMDIAGHITPYSQSIMVYSGQTTEVSGLYTSSNVGVQLSVSLSPIRGQWRIDGGEWRDHGASVANLSAGTHTLEYRALPNHTSPPTETVTLTAGQSLSLDRAYTLVPSVQYSVTDLGSLGGPGATHANALNLAGMVAGTSHIVGGPARAFLYRDGAMQNLGTLGSDPYSSAYGLNDDGDVVGMSSSAGDPTRPFVFRNGAMQDLGSLGGTTGTAYDITNTGFVVGRSQASPTQSYAFIHDGTSLVSLGSLGTDHIAYAINEDGVIVGAARVAGNYHAFRWQDGVMEDVNPLLTTSTSFAYDVNAAGTLVGARIFGGDYRAFSLTAGGLVQDLGRLGSTYAYARGINAAGHVVGNSSADTGNRAFLHRGAGIEDLNHLINLPGVVLEFAEDINDLGQIVANGSNGHAYLLTPLNASGGLRLNLTPASAQWRLDNGAWQASGTTVTGVSAGTHTIEYGSVSGYTTPAAEPIAVVGGQLLTLNRSYTLAPQPAQLTVTLTPASGQWRVGGGTWRASGATATGLVAGNHTVEYNSIAGYTAPASETVTLTAGQSLTLSRSYVVQPGQTARFNVLLTPDTGKWRLNGGAWRGSDSPLFDLPLGSHLVEYNNLGGYSAPPAETITLAAGSTNIQRSYTQLAKFNVILTPGTAKWRLNGGAWRSSDNPIFDLPLGAHLVEYNGLSGYTTPAAETVNLLAGTTTIQRSYTQLAKLNVILTPDTAKWRVDGGAWRSSDTPVFDLPLGAYLIEYKELAGYATPPAETVNVTAGTNNVQRTYVPSP